MDDLIGIVAVKELWAADSFDLEGLARQPMFVPEAAPAGVVMDTLKQEGRHRALVIDEYGAIQGMVTLHDLMEAIVGEIDLVTSPSEQPAIRREDGSWLLDGALPVREARDFLSLGELPGEREGRFQTLAGFMMYRLGRVPRSSDSLRWQDWRFEVMDMDGRRIDKILAVPLPPAEQPDEPEL